MRREPIIERQVNPIGSVVTLTAQLNFPAELLSNDGKIKVVGTETKKITLESKLNSSGVRSLVNDFVTSENYANVQSLPAQISELCAPSSDFSQSSSKMKQKPVNYDAKNCKKVLSEVDENIYNPSKKAEDKETVVHVETPEKRGKNGKARRKISKGEKTKAKVEVDSKSIDDSLTLPSDDLSPVDKSLPQSEVVLPEFEGLPRSEVECEGVLQCSGDIEMQLREASAERDYNEVEECKGRKRSLEVKVNSLVDDLNCDQTNNTVVEDLKINEKTSSRQRKKSRMNDQDICRKKNDNEDNKITERFEEKGNADLSCVSDKHITKVEEKGKTKKKKSKKSNLLSESVCDEIQDNIEHNSELKSDFDIEALMLEVSQETLCPEIFQEIGDQENPSLKSSEKDNTVEVIKALQDMHDDLEEQPISIDNEISEINFSEEKYSTTDDELKGLESDLLVKDSTWTPEKSPEREIDILIDDKDSDKDLDKLKNDETTDKDSSDDCHPIVIKSDSKAGPKRGKNRKLTRKNRDIECKLIDIESKPNESVVEEVIVKSEIVSIQDVEDKKDCSLRDENKKDATKLDSEEEDQFVGVNSSFKEDDHFPDLKGVTDVVKRRTRRRETPDKNQEVNELKLPELDFPKRSWSSIVSSSVEDANGNISKQEESVVPVRSWSSIAAAPAKSKSQESDVIKTNSVEDRDSVYESCNDSVGEEVEPTLDSMGSCYFELETKEEPVTTSLYLKEDKSSESKSGSSPEDKSNTDSGEKDELIVGSQNLSKKSKKQRKKRR